MMGHKPGSEVFEDSAKIKTGGHGRMTKQQAKALKDKWNTKIYGTCDGDNGDNASQSVTPP